MKKGINGLMALSRTLVRASFCMIVGLLLFILLSPGASVYAQYYDVGYGPTDFLIADYNNNRIAVYDRNLVFKHYLSAQVNGVTGLDFLSNGNLVAAGQRSLQQVKQFSPAGEVVTSFADWRVGTPLDLKVGPSNLLYIASQGAVTSIPEFTPAGVFNRTIGSGIYSGALAITPGGTLWASRRPPSNDIEVYDISTGALVTIIALDNGQMQASSMYYSPSTNTVLISDAGTGRVFERTLIGAFVRTFIRPSGIGADFISGVTRGPDGDVFATYDGTAGQFVLRWRADGTFLSSTNISANTPDPVNIVWAGNAGLRPVRSDFDGDFRTDVAVWRPSNGNWYVINSFVGGTSLSPYFVSRFGMDGDVPVPGDYDGDFKTDMAVWRPSTAEWFIDNSSGGPPTIITFGRMGDIPVPADYDGDKRTDIAVWRPSDGFWYITNSRDSSVTIRRWGISGDIPVPGDYDGDGRADITVWHPWDGGWHITPSTGGTPLSFYWGTSGDKPVQSDYDGDAKTDIAVWRPSNGFWYIILSGGGSISRQWGTNGDVPVPGDYDGDGRADTAVWRPWEGRWYVIRSMTNTAHEANWGFGDDVPVPNAYLPRYR